METGKTGVSPPDSGTCPFRSLRQIIRFIWYNYFKQENLFCGRTVEFTFPKLVFAGSSPVARSMNFPTLPSGGVFF